jgi:cytochrome c biogenesis protein CcdA
MDQAPSNHIKGVVEVYVLGGIFGYAWWGAIGSIFRLSMMDD